MNSSSDGTNPAVPYRLCFMDENTYFKVAVPTFWHPGYFSLELVHHYHDDEYVGRIIQALLEDG
jgi:hypothetical protein